MRHGLDGPIKIMSVTLNQKTLHQSEFKIIRLTSQYIKLTIFCRRAIGRIKYMIENGRRMVTRFNPFLCQRRQMQMF